MKLIYPACFYPFEKGDGYTVEVPDLPGCVTEGRDLADAIVMAVDAASGWVLDELEDGKPVPTSSKSEDIKLDRTGFVNLIVLDIDAYAEKYGNQAVRKNLTIPAWLATMADKEKINYSSVLQEALKERLHYTR